MKIGPFGSALKKEYYVEKGIKVYAQENIFKNDFSLGSYYITEDKYLELQSCELIPGDIVISMMGTIGACSVFPKTSEKGIMNSHLLRLQTNDSSLAEYIALQIKDSPFIKQQILKLSVGSIMSGLSSTVVKKLKFPIPSIEEQRKIYLFFKQLDDTITLHQRKLEKLKRLKQGYLQLLFPQDYKKVPRVRFTNFEHEWELRKLGTIFKKIRNAFVGTATPYYIDSGHFYLESNNVKNGEINRDTEVFINDEFYNKQADKLLHTGDIVMVQSGHVGHTAVIPSELDGTAAHALIMFTDYKEDTDPFFLNYQFQTHKSKRKLDTITTGNTIKHILSSEMKEFFVDYPCFEEQQNIGEFFKQLNDTIALNQSTLDKLKLLKQSLLQKMFI